MSSSVKPVGSFWRDRAKLYYYMISDILADGYVIVGWDAELGYMEETVIHKEATQDDFKMSKEERESFDERVDNYFN